MMSDDQLIPRILQAFPNSTCASIIHIYNTGQSGSAVVSANFSSPDRAGLNGCYLIKIGSKDWAIREKVLYHHKILCNDALRPYIADVVAQSREVDGKVAVAYRVAEKYLTWPSLHEILAREAEHEREIPHLPYLLEQTARLILQWNMRPNGNFPEQQYRPYEVLVKLLGKKRIEAIPERVERALPEWKEFGDCFCTGIPQMILPNPLAYLKKERWELLHRVLPTPVGHIHGDLHTGNIICHAESHEFQIIDFSEYRQDSVPLFDLAYLEFDIIRQLLPLRGKKQKARYESKVRWWYLLSFIMQDTVMPQYQLIRDRHAYYAAQLIVPIRQQVKAFIKEADEKKQKGFTVAWWLAVYAAGLNYASKTGSDLCADERMAALLYAAFGLNLALNLLKQQPSQQGVRPLKWVQEFDFTSKAAAYAH